MNKRKSRLLNKRSDDTDVHESDLPVKKRNRTKITGANKLLFDEQGVIDNSSSILLSKYLVNIFVLVDEPTFTTLETVSLNQHGNFNELENSPPPLVIDTSQETDSSQSIMSDYARRSESVEERVSNRTANGDYETQNYLSINRARCISNENRLDIINQSNKECLPEENRTPSIDQSTEDQCELSIRSQSSNFHIIASDDRRRRNSEEDLNFNHTSATPIRPPHHNQISNGFADAFNNSFSVDTISCDIYDTLSSFPDFLCLVKAYQEEQKKCSNLRKEFASLKNDYEQLKANSFPRPPAPALNFLVDLVTLIKQSSGLEDSRSDDQLASDLGEDTTFLMGLKGDTPQETVLNLFNHIYPGYETKAQLGSTKKLKIKNPGLLETILAFAQRSSPGTIYKMRDLQNTLNSSIRGARFRWRKAQSSMIHNAARRKKNRNQMKVQDESRHKRMNDENSLVYQPAATVSTLISFGSIQVQQDNGEDIDNISLSLSLGSINICDIQINVTECKFSTEIKTYHAARLEVNQ
ncbi:unnamed protein product [Rotaria sp. Silwood2]|nr:unnamed protein product [Rotaria sp. Silwood2]